MNQSISTETMMSNNIKTDEENKEKKYNNIDWDHIEKDVVLRMQKILKENGNPDPNIFDDEEYKRLRNEILITLCPFTYKKEEFIDKEEKKASDDPEIPDDYKTYDKIHVTAYDKTPFAKLLLKKIHSEFKYEKEMISVKENLMLEAYNTIIDKIPAYNRYHNSKKETSFMTYIVNECYYTMLSKYKKDYTYLIGKNNVTHVSTEEETYPGGPKYKDIISDDEALGVNPIDELYETNNRFYPLSKDNFNRLFPSDYFMPEERMLIRILTTENNDKFDAIASHITSWANTHPQDKTFKDNDCEYYYDSVIDYICNKGNPDDLKEFLSDREFLLNELKTFGLESPKHKPYTADYIYSTCMRIKRKRERLKELRR